MSRQAEVEKVLREELWTHPDSAIEGFTRAAARIDALYTAPTDGCDEPRCCTNCRKNCVTHAEIRQCGTGFVMWESADHYTPTEGDTA